MKLAYTQRRLLRMSVISYGINKWKWILVYFISSPTKEGWKEREAYLLFVPSFSWLFGFVRAVVPKLCTAPDTFKPAVIEAWPRLRFLESTAGESRHRKALRYRDNGCGWTVNKIKSVIAASCMEDIERLGLSALSRRTSSCPWAIRYWRRVGIKHLRL